MSLLNAAIAALIVILSIILTKILYTESSPVADSLTVLLTTLAIGTSIYFAFGTFNLLSLVISGTVAYGNFALARKAHKNNPDKA